MTLSSIFGMKLGGVCMNYEVLIWFKMIFLGIADQTDSGFFSQTASSVMNSSSSSMSDSFLRRRWMLSNSDFSSSNHQIVRVLSSYSFSTVVCVCTDMGFSKGTKLVFKNSFAKNSGFFIWTIIFGVWTFWICRLLYKVGQQNWLPLHFKM